MTDLRTAAQQALEALESLFNWQVDPERGKRCGDAVVALRAALAEPVAFDHGIGADRFKVVRGAFWWHVLIGDSPTEHGKFRSRASAEKMAADLLREFRNGAFVQHEAALAEPVLNPAPGYCKHCKQYTIEEPLPAEPVQEPVYWEVRCTAHPKWMRVDEQQFDEYVANGWEGQRLYTAPPQRKPMNEFDALRLITESIGHLQSAGPVEGLIGIIRAVERAHNIT